MFTGQLPKQVKRALWVNFFGIKMEAVDIRNNYD